MATKKKQYYGIKFPFTSDNEQGFFLDLNADLKEKTETEIAHIILTQKKTRIMNPDFGTNIIKFIFEPGDDLTWDGVVTEVREAVSKYVPNALISNIDIEKNGENAIRLKIFYSIKMGNKITNNEMTLNLTK